MIILLFVFCVTVGVLHLHEHGMYGELLIKKRNYWPKEFPRAHIDSYMEGKPLGFVKNMRQDMGGVPLKINCNRDDRFVTKLMSTQGLRNEVPNHSTYQKKYGGWVKFKYAEYLSRHNHRNHWVDDVNNKRHDNIVIEQIWHTKLWPTRKFTFIFSVVNSNAVYSRAHGRKAIPEP